MSGKACWHDGVMPILLIIVGSYVPFGMMVFGATFLRRLVGWKPLDAPKKETKSNLFSVQKQARPPFRPGDCSKPPQHLNPNPKAKVAFLVSMHGCFEAHLLWKWCPTLPSQELNPHLERHIPQHMNVDIDTYTCRHVARCGRKCIMAWPWHIRAWLRGCIWKARLEAWHLATWLTSHPSFDWLHFALQHGCTMQHGLEAWHMA